MKNRLDKLFSGQLSKLESAPSALAWDKIHGQLNKNRRSLWSRRLGIAATIFIFISIGYHTSNNQSILNSELVAESFEVKKEFEEQSVFDTEIKENDFNEHDVEHEVESPSIVSDEKIILKKSNPNISLKKEIKISEKKNEVVIEQQTIHEERPIEPLLTILEMENSPQGQASVKQEKSYSQIKIIYKASKNSQLVGTKEKSYIDRGINKINNFSDKHLFTQDRKTMLRNTKEDLLALNFGKLFKN